ncbi:insulinase family protein [Burkholderiaceae bacterium DAT-1]|nr:insulinase family protein [Burkholderiaceae bacterium DAT-1]
MRLKPAALLVLAAMNFMVAHAADMPATSTPAPVVAPQSAAPVKASSVEGITEYRLANGLRVLLAPDASKPTTTVNVTYLVGNRHEKYGETGMAHLLEHLVFKGTPNLPGKTIVQEFAKRGMEFNGTTYYDRTNYFEVFAANDENLDWALKMEADRMVNSNIWRSDLDSEMTVVRNEMEGGENSPMRMFMQKTTAAAFQWHNYGKSTIGARSDVENVNIEHLQAFYRNFYQPDNAVLIVTGKFDEARVLDQVGRYFGSIARPARALEPEWTVEPTQDGPREVTVKRVGDTGIVGAIYHTPAGSDPAYAAVTLLANILGDTPNGRLYKGLVKSKKAAAAGAGDFALHDPGYLLAFAQLAKGQSNDDARKQMLNVLEGFRKEPVTEAELNRAKTAVLNGYEKLMDDPAQFGIELSEKIALGDWRLLFLDRDRIAAVTVADVQRAAETYLVESNRTFGQFVPTDKPVRAEIPARKDVAKMVEGYTGKAAVAAGEDFDPSHANIDARTERFTLESGAKVALLAKKTRGNTVSGSIALHMGDEKSLFGKGYTAQATASLLTHGAGKLSRQQIADKLDELKATLNISPSGAGGVLVSFETKRDKLGAVLALLKDVLRAPTFPEAELDEYKTGQLAAIDANRHQPQAMASNAMSRHAAGTRYKKGDVRYVESFDEQVAAIKSLKLADVKAFHQQFYGANHADIALVGDFDSHEVKQSLKAVAGDWKAKQAYAYIPTPFEPIKGEALTLESPDKAQAFYIAYSPLQVRDDHADAPALKIANRVLGGGALKSRLADRLRQKEGISYGAGSFLSLDSDEPSSSLGMYAIYAPQNLGVLQTSVKEELARFVSEGITEQELEEAKSGILQTSKLARTEDGSLAGALVSQLHRNRTMAVSAAQEARLKALSVADVNAVIRKYLDPQHFLHVYAGDFAGAAKKTEGAVK